MKLILPLLIFISTFAQAKNLDIMECLDLIGFNPDNFSSGDFAKPLNELEPLIDLKNGYYELSDADNSIKYIQATKFNNADGSITLMISGYEYDMVCSRYNTTSYLIMDDGEKIVEMNADDLNLPADPMKFIQSDQLNSVMDKILTELKGGYLGDDATIAQLYKEFFDFHITLPQKGTALIITLTICDYIPTNEVEVNEEDWNIIENSLPTKSYSFDKKFVIFNKQ